MKYWDKFKEKHLGKIEKIFSWLFSILGLIVAILSFVKNDTNLDWAIVLSIVVINSIFLVCISIYETLLYKKGVEYETLLYKEKAESEHSIKEHYDEETEKHNNEIAQLKSQRDSQIYQSDKLRYYYKYIIATFNKFSTQLYAINYKFQKDLSDKNKMLQASLNDADFDEFIKGLKENTYDEYKNSMLKEFNHFLSNVISKLKVTFDIMLKEKDCLLEVAISVKQFNRVVVNPNETNDIRIITIFRDSQTYSQGKREIRGGEYCINKNTAFSHCLFHPYFLKNNISSNDRTYVNEHTEFFNYYNCVIVVPIKCIYQNSTHIYGYLTCDILNDDFSKDNILDERMAEIMEATANIIGIYFDSIDFQWENIFETNFWNIIFNTKK